MTHPTDAEIEAAIKGVELQMVMRKKANKSASVTADYETCLQCARELLALRKGTHEDFWLAPNEPTEKMKEASYRKEEILLGMRSYPSVNHSTIYESMRAACVGGEDV